MTCLNNVITISTTDSLTTVKSNLNSTYYNLFNITYVYDEDLSTTATNTNTANTTNTTNTSNGSEMIAFMDNYTIGNETITLYFISNVTNSSLSN